MFGLVFQLILNGDDVKISLLHICNPVPMYLAL